MPRALPLAVRKAIWNRSLAGQPVAQIAEEFQVSRRTVRRLLDEVRRHGEQAFEASYHTAGVRRSANYAKLRRRSLKLRQQHERWGAGRLRLELIDLYPDHELPCPRTLQRWLHDEGLAPAPSGRPSHGHEDRATRVHQVWEVDAAEQKRLATGEMISWLRLADECSGAVLKTVVFSRRTFSASSSLPRAARIPQDFQGLGMSRNGACRQRGALGLVQRSAIHKQYGGLLCHWPH